MTTGIRKQLATALLGSTLGAMAFLPLAAVADDNYLCDFPEPDGRVYQNYRWFPGELPLRIFIPPVPFATPHPEMYIPLVQKAFLSWGQAAPVFTFQFVKDPRQAQIVVEWREHFPETEDMWGEATLPNPYLTQDGLVRHTVRMHLAVKAQPGSAIGSIGAVPFAYDELLAIVTHEAGHALGMPHSRDEGDIMSYYLSRNLASTTWRITQRDVNTLYALYRLPKQLKVHPCAKK